MTSTWRTLYRKQFQHVMIWRWNRSRYRPTRFRINEHYQNKSMPSRVLILYSIMDADWSYDSKKMVFIIRDDSNKVRRLKDKIIFLHIFVFLLISGAYIEIVGDCHFWKKQKISEIFFDIENKNYIISKFLIAKWEHLKVSWINF